ncbi:MAG: glycosyl hydrolase family 18 protein [Chloroflexota bacterium]
MSEHDRQHERETERDGVADGRGAEDSSGARSHDGGAGGRGRAGRGINHNWWWLAGGVVGAILLLTLFTPLSTPYRSPGPGLPQPSSPPAPAPAPSATLKVLGLYDETSERTTPTAIDLVAANRDKIDYLSPLWYRIGNDGSVNSINANNAQQPAAKANVPIIPRYTNTPGNESFLTNASLRAKAVAGIVADVTKNGWAGCNIDLARPSTAARDGLTAFVADLKAKLPADKLVNLSVIPAAPSDAKSGPYNFTELVKHVDQVILMAHDRHGQNSAPGPVAPITWVEDTIKRAIGEGIPANKIFLGVATYGYDWKTGAKMSAILMPMKKIPVEKTDTHQYDTKAQSAYHTYTDSAGVKHEMWWEDEKSLAPKIDLVRKYGLHGIAICRVGYEDQDWWTSLGTLLNR